MDPSLPAPDDALEHLWNAAHEFLRAMRSLLDAADEFVEQQRAPRSDRNGRDARVHHIDIADDVNIDIADDVNTDIDDDVDVDASWP